MVPGIAPLPTHPVPLPRVHLPATPTGSARLGTWPRAVSGWRNMAVGLKSVHQLTLSVEISGFRGITEVYNLS